MKTRHGSRQPGRATVVIAAGLMALAGWVNADESRWRENYFPNVPLITQDGETVNFYDDVIKDKVVAVNFMFTSCTDVCPLETARLREVQKLLGERVGRDVFFYSISVDPETDTPAVLKRYAERFDIAPGWQFLTGSVADITEVRRRLGLYAEEEPDPSDHNISFIVGNEASGRWMKRSPFDNPQVLAELLGNSLQVRNPVASQAAVEQPKPSYSEAPKLANLTRGDYLWRTRCTSCHTIGRGDGVGPDLMGVTDKRDRQWLTRWMMSPDEMLAEQDPIAMALFKQYDEVSMPNMGLSDKDAAAVIDHMELVSLRHVANGVRLDHQASDDSKKHEHKHEH